MRLHRSKPNTVPTNCEMKTVLKNMDYWQNNTLVGKKMGCSEALLSYSRLMKFSLQNKGSKNDRFSEGTGPQ